MIAQITGHPVLMFYSMNSMFSCQIWLATSLLTSTATGNKMGKKPSDTHGEGHRQRERTINLSAHNSGKHRVYDISQAVTEKVSACI